MLKVILTRGISSSGKSTWAKQKVKQGQGKWKRINKDDLRAMVDCGQWSKEREKLIIDCRNFLLIKFLRDKYNVIIDDTNLAQKHIDDIKNIVAEHNEMLNEDSQWSRNNIEKAEVEIKWFPITLEEALERDSRRPNKVGAEVVKRMWEQYNQIVDAPTPEPFKPVYKKKAVNGYGKPAAIICDLDGTLALFDGKRSPYDASKCADDDVNEAVAYMINMAWRNGCAIILMSGREDKYMPQTINFLTKNGIHYSALHMRKSGDMRGDDIVKEELYRQHVDGRFNVIAWYDDRDKVVNMIRQTLGLPCFQVNYGNF